MADNYAVAIYAMDSDGNVSQPWEFTVHQNDSQDGVPPVVTWTRPGNGVTGIARRPQMAFTATDAGSGVDLNAVRMLVNGQDVTGELTAVGLPDTP